MTSLHKTPTQKNRTKAQTGSQRYGKTGTHTHMTESTAVTDTQTDQ